MVAHVPVERSRATAHVPASHSIGGGGNYYIKSQYVGER